MSCEHEILVDGYKKASFKGAFDYFKPVKACLKCGEVILEMPNEL